MTVEINYVNLYRPSRECIFRAVEILLQGGVIVYPTDTVYGLAGDILSKAAINKILKIKKASKQKLLSFVCNDLKEASKWAHIPDQAFRIMRRVLPGKYTFILPASKEVPKTIIEKRKTVGIRIPDSLIARQIVQELGRPILSTSVPTGSDDFSIDPAEIAQAFKYEIDLILDAGVMPSLPSTVVDFSVNPPNIIREGAGEINFLL